MRKLFVILAAVALVVVTLAIPSGAMAQPQLPNPAQCDTQNAGPGTALSQTGCGEYHPSRIGDLMTLEADCLSNAPWIYPLSKYTIQTANEACDQRVNGVGPLYFQTDMLVDTVTPANTKMKEYLVLNARSTSHDVTPGGLGTFRIMDVTDFYANAKYVANPGDWRIVVLAGTMTDIDSMSYIKYDQWTAGCESDTDPYTSGTQSVRNTECASSETCTPLNPTLNASVETDLVQDGKIETVTVYQGDGDMSYPGYPPYTMNDLVEDKYIRFMYELAITGLDDNNCHTPEQPGDYSNIIMECEQLNYEIYVITEGDEDESGTVGYVDLGTVLGHYDDTADCWCPTAKWWPFR